MPDPFIVYDCSLIVRATGEWVADLQDLLRAVQHMDSFVLEHHMLRCQLADRFEMDEFPNDFARWCWEDVGDHVTAERLGLIDPYLHANYESLRREIIDVLEERLWATDQPVPVSRPGMEFHLVGSQLLAYPTGMHLESAAALAENLPRMSLRSLYYHIHEGRRRTGNETDDFSGWLEAAGADPELVRAIREIDFYFLNLRQLAEALMEVFRQHFPAYQTPAGAIL